MANYSYNDYVRRYSDRFKRVLVDCSYYREIQKFVKELIRAKTQEFHHKIDNDVEYKRHMTGFVGEAAVESYLGLKIIDWTIGNSDRYNIPDIEEYGVGIKTVEKGKYPVIFKKNEYPQIICVRDDKIPNLVFICGLATADVLNKYQDDNLILNPKLRRRGVKTGFYGFEYLKEINSVADLSEKAN